MELPILLGLILLNGLFAMSEIALISARKIRLSQLADNGDAAAAAAMALGEDPTRFLSTVQVGITSIGVLSGIFGEAALAPPVAQWLVAHGVSASHAHSLATVLVVCLVTYTAIVLGELVPKRIGQIYPETIARLVARPMQLLALISRPFIFLLVWSTATVLRLIGIQQKNEPSITEDEIHALLQEGSDAGVIEEQEHAMVRNVFRLDDRQIASLMIPRSEITYIDLDEPLDDNLTRVSEAAFNRFPVCRGGLSNILGILSTKDILQQALKGHDIDLAAQIKPAVFVPESLTGMELLAQIRASNVEMFFVIDEYGEVLGLTTLQDVLEALTGEFSPTSVDDAWAIQREDQSWLMDGLIPIPELKDLLDLSLVPEEEKGRYHTLSGMMMLLLGRLPQTGDHADWSGWHFEIMDMDGKRVDKVLASKLATGEESGDDHSAP